LHATSPYTKAQGEAFRTIFKIHFVGQGLAPAENSALKIRGIKSKKRKPQNYRKCRLHIIFFHYASGI